MNTIVSNIIYNLLRNDTVSNAKNKWCWTRTEPSQHRQPLCKVVLDKQKTTTTTADISLIPQTTMKIALNFKYEYITSNILCSACGKHKANIIIHSPDTDDLFPRCTQHFNGHHQQHKNCTYTQIMEL